MVKDVFFIFAYNFGIIDGVNLDQKGDTQVTHHRQIHGRSREKNKHVNELVYEAE